MQLRSAAPLFSTRDDFEGSRLGCIQLNSIRRNKSEWYSASFTIRRDFPIRAFETPNSVYIFFFVFFVKRQQAASGGSKQTRLRQEAAPSPLPLSATWDTPGEYLPCRVNSVCVIFTWTESEALLVASKKWEKIKSRSEKGRGNSNRNGWKDENVLGGSKFGKRSRYLKLGCLVLWLPLLVSFAERTLLQGVLRIEAFISLFVSNH